MKGSIFMEDTICAISTSMGIGAISIVRVTGPNTIDIVDSIFDHDLKMLQVTQFTMDISNITKK